MKHGRSIALFASLSLGLAIALGPMTAVAKELKATLGVGPKHPAAAVSYPEFFKVAEDKTNKSLSFRMFNSGALLPVRATLTGLRDGVADIGLIVMSYYGGEMKSVQIVSDLSILGRDQAATLGATSEFMMVQCAACIRDFDANGVVQLSGYPVPPYVLISKSKIETLADIRGKKMRSGGGSFSAWAKAVGAVDVNIPIDEMYEAFNAGVIDVGVQTQSGLRAYNFWDTAKHVTELPVGIISSAALFTAGKKMWQGLTPVERSALLDASVAGITAQVEAYDKEVKEIYDPARQRGVTFSRPAADLVKATEDFRRSVADDVAKSAPEKYGNVDIQATVKTYLALLDKWETLVKPVREDYPALARLLQREIYAKVDRAKWGM